MRIKKITLSAFGASALAFMFSACGNAAAVNSTTANTADKSNTTVTAVSKSPEIKSKTSPAPEKHDESDAKSDVKSVDFLNYTYQSTTCADDLGISKKIKVSKGKFKDGDNFYNVKDNNFIDGDVNGDGRADAVVTIECGNTAGTFRSFEIHVFTFENGQAKTLATLDNNQVTEDYTKIYPDSFVFAIPQNGVKTADGNLVVDVMTDGSFAMPKNVSTFIYKLSGDKFTLTAKPTKRSYNP